MGTEVALLGHVPLRGSWHSGHRQSSSIRKNHIPPSNPVRICTSAIPRRIDANPIAHVIHPFYVNAGILDKELIKLPVRRRELVVTTDGRSVPLLLCFVHRALLQLALRILWGLEVVLLARMGGDGTLGGRINGHRVSTASRPNREPKLVAEFTPLHFPASDAPHLATLQLRNLLNNVSKDVIKCFHCAACFYLQCCDCDGTYNRAASLNSLRI